MGRSRFPVLILGETGTGKDLAARAIHNVEARGPFVVVDCSSLVGPLMESELFGYAKGAFTGAHNQKLGLLDAANGGTAFFDEIGELPLELQMKLLRVLQQKEYRAVGALVARSSNFRVIAATNRNLAEEVKANRFRQDLFYRLNVMRLRLPPLRERREDIPALATYFLERYGNGHKVSSDILQALQQYDWPGNIRELEHTVQRMVAMNSGPWLTPADLPTTIVSPNREKEFIAASGQDHQYDAEPAFNPSQNGVMPLAELEKRAILNAIAYTKGDRTIAAAMLGIGRTTLYRKLKEYGLT
jgi:DNA-binding NtrC family response regulator